MSSTEQKNITQPFTALSFTFGILPVLFTGACDGYSLCTGSAPFDGLNDTDNFGDRVRQADRPVEEVHKILPNMRSAPLVTRVCPMLLRICTDARVFYGNAAVMRLTEGIITRRWSLRFGETRAIAHASRHAARVIGSLAPGAYGESRRAAGNVRQLAFQKDSHYLRTAADIIDYLSRSTFHGRHHRAIRSWAGRARHTFGLKSFYRKDTQVKTDLETIDLKAFHTYDHPPALDQKLITTARHGKVRFSIYHYGSIYFFKITTRHNAANDSTLGFKEPGWHNQGRREKGRSSYEVFILTPRDMSDLVFMLQAGAYVKLYHQRRLFDAVDMNTRALLSKAQTYMWEKYVEVMYLCGKHHHLRNKLGVYFDVLQWRYLAWKSGDLFYNHSEIMGHKVVSKGLVDLPDQGPLLRMLKQLPMDIAVDMLGIYKASIYPEVDPFQVVVDQMKLHYSRHNTDWEDGSAERIRFDETRAYMWYLGVRVIKNKFQAWPGRIRAGAEHKEWHDTYKTKGIPGNSWRDAQDVDLTGTVAVATITNEQYMKQQDSACAPPLRKEYESFDAIRRAPRSHRRKLLYAIQEYSLPDLPDILSKMDQIGAELPQGYVGTIDHRFDFSTDIVTGARCERHKDAPRPFYAASPPWGCILSYFDGLSRDFLNSVPQSMLGKSTRQKFMDLGSVTTMRTREVHTFYMSDDKAKYSPRMDPQSQQLPADFFAEVFGIPGIKTSGPIMYHNELYYRVCGHLVHYGSNGTDREGMRGASNTWLEIVAQGLSTRLCRERKLIRGKSMFLSFIDDGLRKFTIDTSKTTEEQDMENARLVIQDVIFGLRVLGRELSWDKTFISRDLFVILNELVYDGAFVSSGLKSFCTSGDLEMKEVMSAPDYEQLYFGKMRGAHGVGTPLDLAHYAYVFETLLCHYKMGAELQDNRDVSNLDYRLFCMTPVAFGGAGLRSALQLGCNEVANATKEGLGNLSRLANDHKMLSVCVTSIMSCPLEPLNPVDFMREPEQVHVRGPRLKTQRLAAEVRKRLGGLARNDLSRKYIRQDAVGMSILAELGKTLMAIGDVSAEEIRLLYSSSPVAFIDEFIQKLASSLTLSELLGRQVISAMRRMVRRDFTDTLHYFRHRCKSRELLNYIRGDLNLLAMMTEIVG